MHGMLQGWTDTICALSTPPGTGAIGVIRVSGPGTFPIVQSMFAARNLQEQHSHTLHHGWLRYEGKVLDEVVIGIFKNPKSFTGEDVIEISTHGSAYVQQQVLEALCAAGCRMARPGEFTQRAFLNGKMNLSQAEAVADLIHSNTEAARNVALNQMRGGFSRELQQLREELIRFSALIELELDFSGEEVEFADRSEFRALIRQIRQSVQMLLQSFRLGNAIKQGIQVAIIGKPNAGKSTLLNALLNEERAIVSDIPGTTRDSIEETLNIQGILFRLIDTAGIRSSKGDAIEDIGIERSKANAAKADIIIHLHDMTDHSPGEDIAWLEAFSAKTLRVSNKYDYARTDQWMARQAGANRAGGIYISAKTGEGLEMLKEELYHKAIGQELNTENPIVTNARHQQALMEVAGSLDNIETGLEAGLPGDLLAPDIRSCLHHLGSITGEITHEDQLDFIFSKFCIGK